MKTNLCQLNNLSCFGCCGHDWKSKKDILAQIKKNTINWKTKTKEQFIKNSEKHLAVCGGCKSLIFKDDKIVCALHSFQNNGSDFRDKNCDKNYFCRTFKEFMNWDKTTQNKFLKFIKSRKIGHYEYSIGMDSGRFLEEFEKIALSQ